MPILDLDFYRLSLIFGIHMLLHAGIHKYMQTRTNKYMCLKLLRRLHISWFTRRFKKDELQVLATIWTMVIWSPSGLTADKFCKNIILISKGETNYIKHHMLLIQLENSTLEILDDPIFHIWNWYINTSKCWQDYNLTLYLIT